MKLKVLIVESVADWYQNKWVEIDLKKYGYFSLVACELRWDLKAHYASIKGGFIDNYDTFCLAPEFDVKSLVKNTDIIDIREIIGNRHNKPHRLFK